MHGGNRKSGMRIHTCTLFYSYFRLHATIETRAVLGIGAIALQEPVVARVFFDGQEPMQKTECRRQSGGLLHEIFVEALVDPAHFPGDGYVRLSLGNYVADLTMDWLLRNAFNDNFKTLMGSFQELVRGWVARNGSARPRLLDIGGRARSGIQYNEHLPECDITTFDIVPAAGVDVVGDAHQLSRHFPRESFEFAYSVSVFEHLVMPWKAAVEVNRVLKPGGCAYIFSHQTIGMHDMPWDFFRFSDAAWSSLFNRYTGFEIVEREMSLPSHIVTRSWLEHHRGNEEANGFECSSVIVRKIGAPTVSWNAEVPEILSTGYPRE
jgi:hypothetical protein